MAWWEIPLALAGGLQAAEKLGLSSGGEQPQPQPQITGGSPSLVPIQHEVRQDPGLIPIGQPQAQMPQAPQMSQPAAQPQGQFFGSYASPFGDPYATGAANPLASGGYSPQEQNMWRNFGGQVGNTMGNFASRLF